jgi:hypothetical protein
MNWVIVLLGILFVFFALLLLFGSEGGKPLQPGARRGRLRKPIHSDTFLPASYDSRCGAQLRDEIARAGRLSLEGWIRFYQKARHQFNSAIVELNLAKLSLDKLDRDRIHMSHQEYQVARGFIETTLDRADRLIDENSDDYPPNISSYSINLRNRLRE